MYSSYSAELPFGEALNKTLDGKNQCPVCDFIEKSRNQDSDKQVVLKVQKFDLMFESFEQTLASPVVFPLIQHCTPQIDFSSPVPEVPPPILG